MHAHPGSAAAPTAGLHFTPDLMMQLEAQGIVLAYVTLHVGLDTFAPVTEAEAEKHAIHTEWCDLSPATATLINKTRADGGRVIAVGTTSVRTLESAARHAASRGLPGSQHIRETPISTFCRVSASTLVDGW